MPNRTTTLICGVVSLIGAVIGAAYLAHRSDTVASAADAPQDVMDTFHSLMAKSQFNDAAAMIALPATLRQDDGGDWILRAPATDYPHVSTIRGTAVQWSHRFARGKIVSYEPLEPGESLTSFRLRTAIMCDPATMVLSFFTGQDMVHIRIDPFRDSPQEFALD